MLPLLLVVTAGARHPGSAPTPDRQTATRKVLAGESAAQPAARPPDRRKPSGPAAQVVSRTTPHLSFSAALSPALVAPGARMSIAFDITPRPGMHVDAPGTQYRAVTVALEPDVVLKIHEAVYPEPSRYLFEPLKEEVLVYAAPFRMLIDVTAGETSAPQAQLRPGARRVIKAALEYQACDDTVCYLPVTVPVQWTVTIAR